MRTTIDLDEDVLLAAKELASRDRVSLGKVVSRTLRAAFTQPQSSHTRNGFPLFPRKEAAESVTLELVNPLRDEGG